MPEHAPERPSDPETRFGDPRNLFAPDGPLCRRMARQTRSEYAADHGETSENKSRGPIMIHETYRVDASRSFGIDIAPAPADGARHPVVVVVHGNTGLAPPYGDALKDFTEQIAALGYLAALPTYYPPDFANPIDIDVDAHRPALAAAIDHLLRRPDADIDRLGLVGFSLGGGVALSYIQAAPPGSVKVFVDFYGLVGRKVAAGVRNVPPTIIFNHAMDPLVPVSLNSEPFADALAAEGIEHEPHAPYAWTPGEGHPFHPGSADDVKTRAAATKWLVDHMPPL